MTEGSSTTHTLGPGVQLHTLVLPLPFQLRQINVYLLEGPGGWALVDAGLATRKSRVALEAQLGALGLEPRQIDQLFVTHYHGDHFGLAAWLQQLGTRVTMPRVDNVGLQRWFHHPDTDAETLAWLRRHGAPQPAVDATAMAVAQMHRATPTFVPDAVADDGDAVELAGVTFEVLETPGHSPGHACLHHGPSRVVLLGDHVLPHITPNISVGPHSPENPLGTYRRSLARLRGLGCALGLPGHGPPILDLDRRIDELLEHHREREQLTLSLVGPDPVTAYTVAEGLFQLSSLDGWDSWMAVGEALAHLQALVAAGQVRTLERADLTLFERA